MYSEFLDSNVTISTKIRDFYEWHGGVKYFGFWAIEITSLACQNKIKSFQKHLQNRLHPCYLRQPHITLVASGLLSEDGFNQNVLAHQIQRIKKGNLKAFSLKLSYCNSFSTCPYLFIDDSFGSLEVLRECINSKDKENNPSKYVPHVTLGFYDNEYSTVEIVEDISNLNSVDIEFQVDEVIFAQYETKDIQGPYEVLHRIKLGN